MPDQPAPDDLTVGPSPGALRPGPSLPVRTWRPRVYRPRPRLVFALALLAGAALVVAVVAVFTGLR